MYEYYNNNKQIVKNTFYSKLLVSPNILKVARISVYICALVYITVGIVGYLIYGFELQDTILKSFLIDMKINENNTEMLILLLILSK